MKSPQRILVTDMAWLSCNMCFKAFLLIAALVTLAHTYKLPEQTKSGIQLAYKCVHLNSASQKGPPVIMLHGLTERKETWNGVYENIPFLTGRKVCIYDARNHGESFWSDSFTVDDLAEDLENFMDYMKIEKAAFVGHSLGGLTAMRLALRNASKVEKLFMEDIGPLKIPNEIMAQIGTNLKLFVDSLQAVPENADEDTAKKAIADFLQKVFKDMSPENLFKQQPLRFRDGVWQWQTNFKGLVKTFEDIDAYLGENKGRYDGETLFIYGTASVFKVGDQKEAIKEMFPKARFVGVEGAGHSIHSKYPEFLRVMIKFLA